MHFGPSNGSPPSTPGGLHFVDPPGCSSVNLVAADKPRYPGLEGDSRSLTATGTPVDCPVYTVPESHGAAVLRIGKR